MAETPQTRRRDRRRPSPALVSVAVTAPPPELPDDPMEFLSRSWSASALQLSKALAATPQPPRIALSPASEEPAIEAPEAATTSEAVTGNPFTFASGAISELVVERIMSQSDGSPMTSGRPSHSGGPFNCGGGGDSFSDSPPLSPSEMEEIKNYRASNTPKPYHCKGTSKTVGRWLKDRRERKKEETRSENAQLHAAVSVACVAAAVAAIAAATAAASGSAKDDRTARTDMAVASAATLVAAQCVEAAESMGAEREHLASVVGSAVNVKTPGDIITLTAAAATALRGAATLKARALKEVWNVAAVIPVEKGDVGNHYSHQRNKRQEKELDSNNSISADEIDREEKFLGNCYQELLARGSELLKRTRKGALHWKIVSVYINRMNQVTLKMKSRHIAGTITKKKKCTVIDVCKDVQAWPGRHLLEGGEQRRYFGLKTTERRVIEFECPSKREHKMWTQGVSRLLDIADERKHKHLKLPF